MVANMGTGWAIMKNVFRYTCLFTLLIVSLILYACSSNSPASVTYFPVQKQVEPIAMEVLLTGKLIQDNGYLRISEELIIWPYGYSLKTEDNDIWVIDDKDQTVARVGDTVKIGGGEIPGYWAEEIIGHPLPAGCEGPYWLAGHINKNE